ncbi:hypothetical protein [Streptomyces fuscigenes]|uniref:hypothetical protein n=1 Tax=Streptomyces fuscigenes TaxID=1528880 RepID=UPI001F38AE2A|nr:hypothetical protein [Streptomyces fuscigenes]MCF3962858.1 hypothetical protein [Streptomyces fuscigenes]
MVRTMSLLRALISAARMVRHTPLLAAGLPPDDAVLLDAPDGQLAPALLSAAAGEYEDAAKLLATTREGAEWESRDRYVMKLAAFAHRRDGWLTRWLRAAPHDPDALVVGAELAVRRAWESPARVELLREAGPLIDAAAGGDERDPVPWRVALDHARGTHASHGHFEELWAQAVRRSAHHYGCHVSALLYLSAQWYGSHRECLDFAEDAAHDALPASLIRTLPVRAAFQQLLDCVPSPVQADRMDRAADLAIGMSGHYRAGDPWPAEARNLLAYVLVRRERWTEALEQFRLIGPYATSFPWTRFSDDPLRDFLETRDGVRLQVASGMPLCPRPGRGGPIAH